MASRTNLLSALLSFVLLSFSLAGQRLELDPDTIVKRLLAGSPLTREARIKIQAAELELSRINYKAILPVFDFSTQFGIVPQDDRTYVTGLGPFVRFELKAMQPFFTFGKISNARDLAACGIDLARIQDVMTRERLVREGVRVFWLLAAARRGEELAGKLRKDYQKLLEDVERDSLKKDSEITATDLLNVKTSLYTVDSLYRGSLEAVGKVQVALQEFLQLGRDMELHATNQLLPEWNTNAITADKVVAFGLQHRPELRALAAGEKAARASLNLARSMMLPDFFIAGGATFRHAPNRALDDDYNDRGLGAFLGLNWHLGFWRRSDDFRQSQLKIKEVREKGALLRQNILLELRQAFLAVDKEWEVLLVVRQSLKHSKTWYRLAGDNWEMGLGKVTEFIKAYTEYYKLEGALLKQELAYANALIQLAHVMGDTNLVLRWFKNEKIDF